MVSSEMGYNYGILVTVTLCLTTIILQVRIYYITHFACWQFHIQPGGPHISTYAKDIPMPFKL